MMILGLVFLFVMQLIAVIRSIIMWPFLSKDTRKLLKRRRGEKKKRILKDMNFQSGKRYPVGKIPRG